MKIGSWNVNGIRACAKKGLFEYLESEDFDVLCLQETKAHPDQLNPDFLSPCQRLSHWSAAARPGYSGTVSYFKKAPIHVSHGIGVRKFDSEGRFVISDHGHFLLFNVYFPNGGASPERHAFKQEFLQVFFRHLRRLLSSGREIILLGDYNVAYLDIDVHDPDRLSQESGFLPEERKWFADFLQLGFVDTFRHFYPQQQNKFTWWSYLENGRARNQGWRIDHICVSRGLRDQIKSCEIADTRMGSDHCPIVITL